MLTNKDSHNVSLQLVHKSTARCAFLFMRV